MKTYLKILIGAMFLIPSSVFATSSVPWSITNLTDTFIFPNNVNGVSKNVYIPQSLGIGTSSPETTLTVQSTATGDATPAFTIDGSGLSNGNGDMELEAGLSSTAEANVDFSRAGTVEWQLGIQNGGGSTGNDFELWDGLNNPVFTVNHSSLDVNIGTTTCGGESELCVWGDGGASSNIFQAITSASSSALSISNAGLTTAINFMATASSTIGDGTQAGGLTISGGATTTGNAYFVGNVGIGSTTPTQALTINNAAGGAIQLNISNGVGGTSGFIGYTAGGTNQSLNIIGKGTGVTFIGAANQAKLGVDSAGDVFLQNGSPSSGTGLPLFRAGANSLTTFNTNGTHIGVNAANGFTGDILNLETNGAEGLVVTGGLNVGIGTSTPTSQLEIFNTAALTALNSSLRFSNQSAGTIAEIDTAAQTAGAGGQLFFNFLNPTTGTNNTNQNNWLAYRFGGANNKWFFGDSGTTAFFQTVHPMYFLAQTTLLPNITSFPTLTVDTTFRVGVGSTSPFAKFSVHAQNGDTNNTLFAIASSTSNSTTTLFSISNTGHIVTGGNKPTVSSCGTTNTVNGTDEGGTIVLTGTLVTACTMTLAQPVPAGLNLSCTATSGNGTAFAFVSATSSTGVIFGLSGSVSADTIYYNCDQNINN